MNPAENYILKQQEPFKSILLQLQVLIESSFPELELKYKWRLPYYYLNGTPFCFLHVSKGYVDVGLHKGYELQKHVEVLVGEKRTKIKSLRYFSVEDVQAEILLEVLEESKSLYV